MTEHRPLYVIGLGLIGGSILRAASRHRETGGWSPSAATRAAAAAEGYRVPDELDSVLAAVLAADGLLMLAVPPAAMSDLLGRIDGAAPTVRLTDACSIKLPLAEQVAALAPRSRYVGSHPMAGTQHSGWSAGSAELFGGAAWVICLSDDSDLEVWTDVAGLALAVGSRVVPTEPGAHDEAVARISHLPHLLALTLAQVGAGGGALALSLAATSFADGTRVAATRPELIRAMCENNREALVSAMDEALGLLGVARGSLASTGSLSKLTEAGHRARGEFEAVGTDLSELTLYGEDMIDQLLAIGSAGGHVTALDTSTGSLRVTAWFPDLG